VAQFWRLRSFLKTDQSEINRHQANMLPLWLVLFHNFGSQMTFGIGFDYKTNKIRNVFINILCFFFPLSLGIPIEEYCILNLYPSLQNAIYESNIKNKLMGKIHFLIIGLVNKCSIRFFVFSKKIL